MARQIPNIFTLLNMVFGCLAIVITLQNGIVIQYTPDGTQLVDIPERIWLASLFIGLAGLIDFLDGFVARLFKAASEMGKQLDSLADVISFGVAPAMIFYQFLRLGIAKEEDGINTSIAWLMPAFILACASAWRLAKFNLDDSQSFGFKGLPTPAVGLLIASLPLIYWNEQNETLVNLLLNKWFLYGLILLLSLLMISNLPIMSLKFNSYKGRNNILKIILFMVSIVASFLFHWLAVPIIFSVYIILSLIFKQQNI